MTDHSSSLEDLLARYSSISPDSTTEEKQLVTRQLREWRRRAPERLLECATADESLERCAFIEALESPVSAAESGALLGLLSDSDSMVVRRAVRCVTDLGLECLEETVRRLLQHRDANVKVGAVGLWRGKDRLNGILIELLSQDESVIVREEVAKALRDSPRNVQHVL